MKQKTKTTYEQKTRDVLPTQKSGKEIRVEDGPLLLRTEKESAMKKKIEKKELWEIEKFIPLHCPKCNRRFGKLYRDFVFFFGDIIDGKEVPRQTPGHDIIVCQHCDNHTAIVWLERRTVETEKEANLLAEKEGYTNPQLVITYGKMAKPTTYIFNKIQVGRSFTIPRKTAKR